MDRPYPFSPLQRLAGASFGLAAPGVATALAEREAAQEARRRRWGAMLCHMRNDPYEDLFSPAGRRP